MKKDEGKKEDFFEFPIQPLPMVNKKKCAALHHPLSLAAPAAAAAACEPASERASERAIYAKKDWTGSPGRSGQPTVCLYVWDLQEQRGLKLQWSK